MPSIENQSTRVALVVLGMHRSGTSATAGLMSHLGCGLPKELMTPSAANLKGYFESVKVYRLNEALLASGGSSWDDPTAFQNSWYASPLYPEFRERAAGVLQEEFNDSQLFVLKDPRICRLLPFWRDVLERQGAVAHYVCIHRHPREVAASLSRREGWPETMGLLLWLRHVLEAERNSRGALRIFISYDLLMSDWRRVVTNIGEGLNIEWPLPIDRAAIAADEFLSEELRHFRTQVSAMALPSGAPDWTAAVYDILDRWSELGERTVDHARLDAIKAALDESSIMIGRLVGDCRELSAGAAKVETQLKDIRSALIAHYPHCPTEPQFAGGGGASPTTIEAPEDISSIRVAVASSLTRLQIEVHDRDQKLDALRLERQADLEELARLQGERDDERRRVAESRELITKLEDAIRGSERLRLDGEAALSKLESVYLERGHELENERSLAVAATAAVAKFQAELNATGKRLVQVEERHRRDSETAAASANTLVSELEASRSALISERLRFDRLLAEFDAYKMAVRSSTSWRLTAPLRALSRTLERVRASDGSRY